MTRAGGSQDAHLDEHGEPRIIERRFVVEDECAGWRLDHFLKKKIPRLSRTRLQELIRTHLARGDGRRMKAHSPVQPGDVYLLRTPARPEPPCPRTFEVLHRDEAVLVIDKPAGLPVHASAKFYFNTLTRVLLERYPDEPLQICHRLDRETSGCLVVARSKEAARHLKGAFAAKTAHKRYLAIVHGAPDWDERVIDLPLGLARPEEGLDVRMVVRDDAPPARTRARVLERRGDHALLELEPVTGRQHQLRAHLAAVGHPIVGDKLYAHGDAAFMAFCDGGMTAELAALFRLPRQALHARSIRMPHPAGGELAVEAPFPADLQRFWDALPAA